MSLGDVLIDDNDRVFIEIGDEYNDDGFISWYFLDIDTLRIEEFSLPKAMDMTKVGNCGLRSVIKSAHYLSNEYLSRENKLDSLEDDYFQFQDEIHTLQEELINNEVTSEEFYKQLWKKSNAILYKYAFAKNFSRGFHGDTE